MKAKFNDAVVTERKAALHPQWGAVTRSRSTAFGTSPPRWSGAPTASMWTFSSSS